MDEPGREVPLTDQEAREIGRAVVHEDGTFTAQTGIAPPVDPSVFAGRMSFAFREPDPEDQPRDPLAPARLRINWRDRPDQEEG